MQIRHGGAAKIVVFLLIVAVVVGGAFAWRWKRSHTTKQVNLIFATVERGTFIHEVSGKGSAESAKNVDVASQVEGTATIIYLIPEGSNVKKGDLLVELDSSAIDEKYDSQVVTTNSSRATLNSSRATLRSNEISLEEYVEGTFEQSWMEYANTIFEAEQTRKQNADSARFTEHLLNLNYSTELQYEIDKVAEEKAKNSLEVANLKKNTLLKFTSEKQITSLMSDIETARAKVESDKNSYNINLSRENRLHQQSQNCKILAPQDGQVVYANQDSRRMSESDMIKEGSTVYQRQVLIRLPDKTQMQVKTMINESNISAVKTGMPAKISFDSIPNRVIEGEVVKVNLYPEIVWMSSAKDYVTLVKIKEDVEELRSGLTAQVRIIADEQTDVLMVPVQCVTEYGKKTYCITYTDGKWGYKEVLLGASNEKQVIVLGGLEEGDVVVSGARLYRDNVEFPAPDAPSDFENSEVYQEKLLAAKEEEEKNAEIEAGGLPEGGFPGGGMPGAGFPGGGAPGDGTTGDGSPGRGRPEGGMPNPDMLAGLAEKISSGDIPPEVLANIPPELLAQIQGGSSEQLSDAELEKLRQKEEAAATYNRSITERLERDGKVARIEPFFTRTVMEMQRELLAAISTRTNEVRARIATRQNAISRRQDEIELLQKSASSDDSSADASEQIERLTEEIKTLRGDSDYDVLERVVYDDLIDWELYIHGNDITREALTFLSEDPDYLFNQLFPNSSEVDSVVKLDTEGIEDVADRLEVETDEDWLDSSDSTSASLDSNDRDSMQQYAAFLPLFDLWDTNGNGILTPTEFVIGFFSDRKGFQNTETDDVIDGYFAEYIPGDSDAKEFSLEEAQPIVNRILSERSDADSSRADASRSSRRGGGRGGNRGGMGSMTGMPGGSQGDPIGGSQGGMPGAPQGGNDQDVSSRVAEGAPGGEGNPRMGARPPRGDGAQGNDEGQPPARPEGDNRPIQSLAEATSLRQAIAFYLPKIDFDNDGYIQKSEFVVGYNEIKEVVGKMFANVTTVNAVDNGGGMGGMGGFGPPPR
ncbi:MAG: HlyD family efflux transporter periplasmic adaptor subunit [Planctomycetia bacterium]|nr:HlyD family efflux transporter periplasmic adaptor subunit [Planctomycetia bacterium]